MLMKIGILYFNYDLFSRLWYIATCGPFCKDATHIGYEPADLNVHPPKKKTIEGGLIFFHIGV